MPPDPHSPACLHMHAYIARTSIAKQSTLILPRLVCFLQTCSAGKHTSVVVSQATPKLMQGYITYIRIRSVAHSSPFHRMILRWNKPFDRATTDLSSPPPTPPQISSSYKLLWGIAFLLNPSTPSLFLSISCSHYIKPKTFTISNG